MYYMYILFICIYVCLYVHRDSIKSKPECLFNKYSIPDLIMKMVLNIFSNFTIWFDYLIKEDVQNGLLLLAHKPGGRQHYR